MTKRNRSEGWTHAKHTGHENEKKIAELVKNNPQIQKRLLSCAHLDENITIKEIKYGGICESDVDCIIGDEKTKSKTDMWLLLSNGERLNISIKKSLQGQVFLIGIDRFIEGFEKQYKKNIPDEVKRGISLYFGSAEDTIEIVNGYGSKYKSLETRKHRLVAKTLKSYDESLATNLIKWFNDNITDLFNYCFSRGLAKNKEDWAEIVWYKNTVGENSFDRLFFLPDIKFVPGSATYGDKNGGSTIQLPFGFVQWHSPRKKIPGDLQFHHQYKKLLELNS